MKNITAAPVNINWNPELSIYASESFLKSVGDEYGWLGGIDSSERLRCILPYTIICKMGFRMARFRIETIVLGEKLELEEEKSFLNGVTDYFRSSGADMIIPASTNTIFQTFPDGAVAAPYGSYVLDLSRPDDMLWKGIKKKTRQNIQTAVKNGVRVHSGIEYLDAVYALTRDTLKRSNAPFMSYESLKRYVNGLGENAKIMIADHQGTVQSGIIYAFSDYSAYAVYGGNTANLHQGANKLLHWEAMRLFRELGVQRYDFVGARIDPPQGSKHWGIDLLKRHFGAELKRGYMWKLPLKPLKYLIYCLAVRLIRKGDIVDKERHKMNRAETLT